MNNDIKEILYSKEDIQAVAQKLGAQITADMKDKNPLVICVLKGAILFMADIVREIDTYCELDFMDVSSYGDATESSGEVKIIKDLDVSVKDRHILIVEDIIDTGRTLERLVELLKHRNAASVKICTLLDKPSRRVVEVPVDYTGFEIPDEFVVGYGLDDVQKYRNLPFIGVVED